MQYTKLKGIDREVSRIAFGCMSTVGSQTYPGVTDGDAVSTMRRAFELGVNFFDTARAYADGESERQLGEAIAGFRDEVVIASKPKAGDLSKAEIISECEKSLKDLGVERIDLYQIHWPRRQVPLEETARAMDMLVEQGKIGAVGVCNFGPLDLGEWLESGTCATDQVAYSLISRGADFKLSDKCAEHGIGILCYSPLAQGLLAGVYDKADDVPSGKARTRHFAGTRPEARHGEAGLEDETFEAIANIRRVADRLGEPMGRVSLAWLLHQPAVASVLCGASKPSQVERNVAAASLTLSEQDLEELDRGTAALKDSMGASLDMWQSPARTR
ncbi:MAG: aldo/keto reductase [Planctomycetota bacterium]